MSKTSQRATHHRETCIRAILVLVILLLIGMFVHLAVLLGWYN